MKLLDYIVCDDVRNELGGKFSLMGVFGDSINVQVPHGVTGAIAIPITVYLRVLLEERDSVPDGFKVVIKINGKEFAGVEGTIEVSANKPNILGFVIPIRKFQVFENSTISLTATFTSGGQPIAELSPSYDISIKILHADKSIAPAG